MAVAHSDPLLAAEYPSQPPILVVLRQPIESAGEFTITVKGTEWVMTPAGREEAWVLGARSSVAQRLTYQIAKRERKELVYSSPQGRQRLGGTCDGLE